jgi:hypothetical protein
VILAAQRRLMYDPIKVSYPWILLCPHDAGGVGGTHVTRCGFGTKRVMRESPYHAAEILRRGKSGMEVSCPYCLSLIGAVD